MTGLARQSAQGGLVLLVFLLSLQLGFCRGYLEQHLRDAIRLNSSRLPLYSALTDGDSEATSKSLIRTERLALIGARVLDSLARPYQKKGVPVVAEDMVDMSETPDFIETHPLQPLPLHFFHATNASKLRRRLRRAYKDGGYPRVEQVCTREIAKLEGLIHYHCMVRHTLESLRRMAHLAPKHFALARSKGIKPPKHVCWLLLQGHLAALASSARLDKRAAPIQALGIPIIGQDVPHIDTYSDFYDAGTKSN